jgi:hypothetical protein
LLPLGRRAVDEDVVAFDEAPASEEAAGVDLGDRNLDGFGIVAGDLMMGGDDGFRDLRLPAFGEHVAGDLDQVPSHRCYHSSWGA